MGQRAWILVIAAVVSVTLAASRGHGSDGPRGYTTWEETFVDTSRPTRHPSGVTDPQRTLMTAIYRPAGKGPFPLIVFAHGFAGHPEKFTKLFAAWAAGGYVVAAPAFPLTNDRVTIDAGDTAQQPADVSFVLDEVLALAKRRGSRLFRDIRRSRVGVAGLSLGGVTTYTVVYGDCCRDSRITAAMVLNSVQVAAIDGHVPLFIGHSDTDPLLSYATARASFVAAEAPVWLHTFHGASHASQWEDDVTPYDHIAEQATLDFWNATLKRKRRAFARLERDATVPGLSSIEAKR